MPHKEEIFEALNRLVAAHRRALTTGGIRDELPTDPDSPDEEILVDELPRLDQLSPLNTPGSNA